MSSEERRLAPAMRDTTVMVEGRICVREEKTGWLRRMMFTLRRFGFGMGAEQPQLVRLHRESARVAST